MTHYNTSYAGLTTSEKNTKSLQDIRDYLGGRKKFDELTEAFRTERPNQKAFTFYCGLAGVQYYPVIAWWEYCFPDLPWQDEAEED